MFSPEVGEINAHAQTAYSRPFPPPNFRRPGYEATLKCCRDSGTLRFLFAKTE